MSSCSELESQEVARWFAWPLVGDEEIYQRRQAAIRTLLNSSINIESKNHWTLDEILNTDVLSGCIFS